MCMYVCMCMCVCSIVHVYIYVYTRMYVYVCVRIYSGCYYNMHLLIDFSVLASFTLSNAALYSTMSNAPMLKWRFRKISYYYYYYYCYLSTQCTKTLQKPSCN